MPYRVRILKQAQVDVDTIFGWIAAHAPQGAATWYQAFCNAIVDINEDPFLAEIAPECRHLDREIRQRMFRTRRGRNYRILFAVVEDEVRVLRVRGPGQRPVRSDELNS
jgi:plasmid stabilization system protein ParE